ncbi:MAG: HEAT repeat domain-containing protein [Candidatus Riflebacteria bacterium]|nr:HEAT repeat domain-containing protein [Candidatus Riflebacteria bacterium]
MIWPFNSTESSSDLLSQLLEGSMAERKASIEKLLKSDDPELNALIISCMRTMDPEKSVNANALLEIIGLRKIEEGIEFIKRFLSSPDSENVRAAVGALLNMQSQSALEILIPMLENSDLELRRTVHEGIVNCFQDSATGALIRSVPDDHNSQMYFEIVSLLEETGYFSKAREMFLSSDLELKKFQFQNIVKFYRPDFIPFFLELLETGGSSIQVKIRRTLSEYTTEELIKPVSDALRINPSKNILKLVEDILLNRSDTRSHLIHAASGITKREIRTDFVTKILRKMDPTMFLPALVLMDDPSPQIRSLVVDNLISLAQNTNRRIADPEETNRTFLKEQIEIWVEELHQHISVESHSEVLADFGKLLFSVGGNNINSMLPSLPKLLEYAHAETIKNIISLPAEQKSDLVYSSVKSDPSLAETYIKALSKLPHAEIFKPLVHCIEYFSKEDRDSFRKLLMKPFPSFSVYDLLNDENAETRLSVLQLISETNFDILKIIEEKTSDPDSRIRELAISLAISHKHPKLESILDDACVDPAANVVIMALSGLKSLSASQSFSSKLARAVNHPAEEVRYFALREIARLTQAKYIQNFKNLAPEIRKLAGAAISKLDGNFVDHLITELRSLDPETRLRAVLIMENLQVSDRGTDALLSAMKDPSKKVRAAIVKTLGIIGNHQLLSRLVEFLNDPDERVRANTIEAVISIGREEALSIVLPFLEDSNNRIRANAALAAWQIGQIDIMPVIRKMLSLKDNGMRASALWVLGEIRAQDYVNLIMPFIRDLNDMIRLNAVRAIGKIQPDLLKPYIPQLRRDNSAEIKKYITEISFRII